MGALFSVCEYPQLLNPPSGFLQNCNNPYWVSTKNSGLKPREPAPVLSFSPIQANAGEESLNTRGERLFQVLTQDKKFTLRDMMDLSFDTYVLPAGRCHCAFARRRRWPHGSRFRTNASPAR